MRKFSARDIEWGVLISAVLLTMLGIIALFSATGEETNFEECKKQILWFGVSLILMTVIIFMDYHFLAKMSPFLYFSALIFLIAVLFTKPVNGARSWFDLGAFSFQPSELTKVFLVMFVSQLIVYLRKKGSRNINKFWKLALIIISVAIPTVLIIKQPDYGTAMVFMVMIACMLFVSGIKRRYIIIVFVSILIILPILYFFVLPEHAVNRIKVFFNPGLDPKGIGYNIIQSKLAIGSRTT